ncbi:tropinone reductase-like 2 [Vitis riparia]|uniref:tropinone reductase-like 2 n=1 Tax=Vitis riparia TaxID=96939 RepID=UPI00155ABEBA|nr:tropinone reductase-like 2 [Vitis riparia]
MSTHSYAASKHAVVGLAKNLAAELGQHNIRVNCVSPYVVSTNIGQGLADFTPKVEAILNEVGNLKGTVLKASDVASATLFLASDEATYVSGLNLVVDGRYSVVNSSIVVAVRSSLLHA